MAEHLGSGYAEHLSPKPDVRCRRTDGSHGCRHLRPPCSVIGFSNIHLHLVGVDWNHFTASAGPCSTCFHSSPGSTLAQSISGLGHGSGGAQ